MAFSAKVLADSISPEEVRLTTLEVTFPRMILAEFNTHRVFSRNSASSRAIPVHKQLARIKEHPFIPEYWGANQAGMQAEKELTGKAAEQAKEEWLAARDSAVEHVEKLLEIGLHKQLSNRVLEAFMWHTVIVTATEWDNFFALRAHSDAQPEIRKPADLIKKALDESTPRKLGYGQWHMPLIQDDEDFSLEECLKISCGRCARVSYLTHDGVRDPAKDIELYERLVDSGHMSPLEHAARPMKKGEDQKGNFRGWHQHRADIAHENNYGAR